MIFSIILIFLTFFSKWNSPKNSAPKINPNIQIGSGNWSQKVINSKELKDFSSLDKEIELIAINLNSISV
ncbi:MAG: hypothetical protein CMB82_02450 [Flammeovirgaceae bacterium]|nr:hypothetical protein [Flammeovirgaceae bacterium]